MVGFIHSYAHPKTTLLRPLFQRGKFRHLELSNHTISFWGHEASTPLLVHSATTSSVAARTFRPSQAGGLIEILVERIWRMRTDLCLLLSPSPAHKGHHEQSLNEQLGSSMGLFTVSTVYIVGPFGRVFLPHDCRCFHGFQTGSHIIRYLNLISSEVNCRALRAFSDENICSSREKKSMTPAQKHDYPPSRHKG